MVYSESSNFVSHSPTSPSMLGCTNEAGQPVLCKASCGKAPCVCAEGAATEKIPKEKMGEGADCAEKCMATFDCNFFVKHDEGGECEYFRTCFQMTAGTGKKSDTVFVVDIPEWARVIGKDTMMKHSHSDLRAATYITKIGDTETGTRADVLSQLASVRNAGSKGPPVLIEYKQPHATPKVTFQRTPPGGKFCQNVGNGADRTTVEARTKLYGACLEAGCSWSVGERSGQEGLVGICKEDKQVGSSRGCTVSWGDDASTEFWRIDSLDAAQVEVPCEEVTDRETCELTSFPGTELLFNSGQAACKWLGKQLPFKLFPTGECEASRKGNCRKI